MIRTHFNLKNIPFLKNIQPDSLFQSSIFKEGLERLEYIKNHRGIMLLTGEPGTGKSTLLRSFSCSLNQNSYHCFYLPLSTVNILDFYRQLNFALCGTNIFRKADLYRSIQQNIKSLVTNRKIVPVLIFDEAHLFKNENFFELQLMLNFDYDSVCPAIVVVAGQSHLRERLSRDIHLPFARRISIKYHLTPLSKEECFKFIEHSMYLVGGSLSLFDNNALEAIFSNSNGNPSFIANITTKSLTAAAINNKSVVSEEEVFLATKES